MNTRKTQVWGAWAAGCLASLVITAAAGDITSYSILKGQFLSQTGPTTTITDPDFGFSLLVSVEQADFYLINEASVALPDGSVLSLEDNGASWDYLDSVSSLAMLNADYGWGPYQVNFSSINDGQNSCPLNFPATPLPPAPRATNFVALQSVDPAQPTDVLWNYPSPPRSNDFVQVYVTLGHGEVFSSPNLGMPGALDGAARSTTIPAGTLDPGVRYSLTIEITRLTGSNTTSYAEAEGVSAVFSSTSLDLITTRPPELRMISTPTNGTMIIEVQSTPEATVVLQTSGQLLTWNNVDTNVAVSGLSQFTVPLNTDGTGFYRAMVHPK